jgi:hypothetical protein
LTNNRQQAGWVSYEVNDTWWGDKGTEWNGNNVSYPMYWAISPASQTWDPAAITPQATFTAVRECSNQHICTPEPPF